MQIKKYYCEINCKYKWTAIFKKLRILSFVFSTVPKINRTRLVTLSLLEKQCFHVCQRRGLRSGNVD